ncbi:MAG: ribonuclease III [Flavobacteriales bacterium]|nr:ribonuclease III [Flavobacteriales bacterium]
MYETALTHSSYIENRPEQENNEKLEFLGDSILDAVVANYLIKKYPKKREGELTQIRSRIVNRAQLNRLALKIRLHEVLKVSKTDIQNTSIPGNALEAILGAIYLDKGYDFCKDFIESELIKNNLDMNQIITKDENYKSLLLEWAQKRSKRIAFTHEQINSEKNISFEVTLSLNGDEKARANAPTKKRAEQIASKAVWLGLVAANKE